MMDWKEEYDNLNDAYQDVCNHNRELRATIAKLDAGKKNYERIAMDKLEYVRSDCQTEVNENIRLRGMISALEYCVGCFAGRLDL